MSQKILIDCSGENQTQVALLSESGLEDFEYESISKLNLKGNIYLGKVSRIEASLQAAFVDIGSEKNGFLAFSEIHPNYFQIPVADREAFKLRQQMKKSIKVIMKLMKLQRKMSPKLKIMREKVRIAIIKSLKIQKTLMMRRMNLAKQHIKEKIILI